MATSAKYAREWRARNREHYLSYYRNYRVSHPQKSLMDLKRIRKWRSAHPIESRLRTRIALASWRKRNPVRANQIVQKYRKTNVSARIAHNLRSRVLLALKRKSKGGHTIALLGCSIAQLISHLESRFRRGMAWGNYGSVWQMDHIKPCASFNLTLPSEQMKCFHWSNIQPLFSKENLLKSDNI